MLCNPFTPSEIASDPGDFFGRDHELRALERSLLQGSVVIQGPIGIGKSPLLARGILSLEGFDSKNRCRALCAVGDKSVTTLDDAARLLLESFTRVDEAQKKVTLRLGSEKLGTAFAFESTELYRSFAEGRHLAALKRVVEEDYLAHILADDRFLILAVDEADKCPKPLAQVVRSLVTHTQQCGVKRIRFLLAGVSPFYQEMLSEDLGIGRFVYQAISLLPMDEEEATDLVETKLTVVCDETDADGLGLTIEPSIIGRIVALSGGHPHVLQLLGSHLIESENDDPDGSIDSHDLLNSLQRVCYEDRASAYRSTLHFLELNDKLDTLSTLLGMSSESPARIVSSGFPTRIDRELARVYLDPADIQWLVDHSLLSTPVPGFYGLIDEFLRIRLVLDSLDSELDRSRLQGNLAAEGSFE